MGNMSLEQVTENYYDVLRELGNIGAGNAMTALSQMLQCKVDMQVPQVRLLEFSEVGEMIGGEEQIMAGVFLGVKGDITGSMMFMVEEESARHLIAKMTMGMLPPGSEFEEMGLSAMKELAGAILSVPAIQFGVYGDKILLIQSQFNDDVQLDGYFIMIPDLESYAKILTALGLPVV